MVRFVALATPSVAGSPQTPLIFPTLPTVAEISVPGMSVLMVGCRRQRFNFKREFVTEARRDAHGIGPWEKWSHAGLNRGPYGY